MDLSEKIFLALYLLALATSLFLGRRMQLFSKMGLNTAISLILCIATYYFFEFHQRVLSIQEIALAFFAPWLLLTLVKINNFAIDLEFSALKKLIDYWTQSKNK